MKLVDWSSAFKNIFKIDLLTDTYLILFISRKEIEQCFYMFKCIQK